jgi:hypothetical protein
MCAHGRLASFLIDGAHFALILSTLLALMDESSLSTAIAGGISAVLTMAIVPGLAARFLK